MKKKLSLLFALMLSTLTANAYGTLIDGIYYKLGLRRISEGTYKSYAAVTYYSLTSNDSVYYGNIVIPPSVKESFGYTVTDLGEKAFFNCTRLSSVSIPNSVTSIRDSVFFGCCSLTSITIPNGVTYIGKHAFSGCNNLDSIFVSYEQPSAVDANAFDGISDKAVLYVPYGKKSLYESLEGWNRISTIKEALIDGSIFTASTPEGVNMKFRVISEENKTAEVYGSYGTMIEVATPLYRIPAATVNPAISDTVSIGITIPEVVDGYKVVALSDFAFSSCNLLPFISIPESVKIIGISAFSGCSSLTNITIPNSVTSIGRGTFHGCSKLTSIIIPSSVTTIEMHTFSECSNISSISLPLSITKISEESFDYCRSLSSINLPNSLTTIGANAFNDCDNLKSIVIPSSVTSIGMDASNTISNPFENCSSLESIVVETGNTVYDSRNNCNAIIRKIDNELIVGCKNSFIPNSVTSIGNNAFSGCSWLSSVTIPNNVTRIGYGAFSNCASLTSINIPNVCTEISAEAFLGCTNLTFVNIPNECSTIGDDAFSDCHSLLTITFPQHIKSIGARAFADCSSLGNVTSLSIQPITIETNTFLRISDNAKLYVPSGSKAKYENIEGWDRFKTIEEILIDGSTFTAHTEDGVELKFTVISTSEKTCKVSGLVDYRTEGKITIPSEVNSFRVTEIGDAAFGKCDRITSVNIPNSITTIGSLAFGNCSSLSTINLPNSITTIGANAFNGCKSLKSIVIPSSVTSIGEGAAYTSNPFCYCSSLESIVVETGNTVYDSREGCNAIITKTVSNPATATQTVTLITGCKNTIIPSSVQAIGSYAFAGTGLTHIEIPGSVESISSDAFYSDTIQINKFINHSTLDAAHNNYWGCTILDTSTEDGFYISDGKLLKYTGSDTEIVIPDIVTSISGYVFSGRNDITSITIPTTVTSIGYGAFLHCSSLKSVNIPSGVTVINDNTFNGCTNLSSIELPKGLTSIGQFAFANCNSLEVITFPGSLNSIGSGAFQGCKNLTEVYCFASACPETGIDVFLDCNISTSTLYVREQSSNLYKATVPWAEFGQIKTVQISTIQSNNTFVANTEEGVEMRFHITNSEEKTAEVYGYRDYYYIGQKIQYRYYPAVSTSVSAVTIPSMVYTTAGEYKITSISVDAFHGCNLRSINIPNTIHTIKSYAFEGCSLTQVTLPDSLCNLESEAFYNCSSLQSVNIPEKIKGFGYAFYGCTNLKKIIVSNLSAWCSMNFSGDPLNSNPLTYAHHIYSDENTEITNLILPDNLTAIGNFAFDGCTNISSVTFPKSIRRIGNGAFRNCNKLTSITIPDNIEEIYGTSPFDGCTSLSSVNYNNSTVYNWFQELSSIKEIILGENVKIIVYNAFKGCTNLSSIIIPDSVTSIGNSAFSNYTKLYTNRGTTSLLALWSAGVIPYETNSEHLLLSPKPLCQATQTTLSLKLDNLYEEYTYEYSCYGFWGYLPYKGNVISLEGLNPGDSQTLRLKVSMDNVYYVTDMEFKTQELSPVVNAKSVTSSSLSASGTYNHGDAVVTKETLAICKEMKKSEYADNSAYCSIYNPDATNRSDFYSNYYLVDGTESVEGSKVSFHGLDPSTGYYVVYNVYIGSKNYSAVLYKTTEPLNLTTNPAKIISVGNAIVSATTNLDDEETNVGFEWRRIDWPDNFTSNKANATLYEGEMGGYIRNINPDKFWTFRPYYLSDSGTYYYGNWIGFDPTNTSYFEPTVRTSSAYTVLETTANVKGYAMRGTDNIVSQGFKYWSQANNARSIVPQSTAVPSNVKTVETTGNIMTAEFTDLEYETEYHYVAYVTTSEDETFYGEECTFTTGKRPSPRGDVNGDGEVGMPDVISVVNYILGTPAETFNADAADANQDGEIGMPDVMFIMNYILNGKFPDEK